MFSTLLASEDDEIQNTRHHSSIVSTNSNISNVSQSSDQPFQSWIECMEIQGGRHFWLNSRTLQISFDKRTIAVPSHKPSIVMKEIPESQQKSNKYSFIPKSMFSWHSSQESTDNEIVESKVDNDTALISNSIYAEHISDDEIPNYLLQFADHQWNFNNDFVDVYHYQCSLINHTLMIPHPMLAVFPEFFSNDPIPAKRSFIVRVLPPPDFPTPSQHWKVSITVHQTCSADLITKMVDKLRKSLINHELYGNDNFWIWNQREFVLKVLGCEEYILYSHEKLIIEYEAVRRAVRNEDDVTFILVFRPDFDHIQHEQFEKCVWYMKQIQDKYHKIFPDLKQKFINKPLLYQKYGYGTGESLTEKLNAMTEHAWQTKLKEMANDTSYINHTSNQSSKDNNHIPLPNPYSMSKTDLTFFNINNNNNNIINKLNKKIDNLSPAFKHSLSLCHSYANIHGRSHTTSFAMNKRVTQMMNSQTLHISTNEVTAGFSDSDDVHHLSQVIKTKLSMSKSSGSLILIDPGLSEPLILPLNDDTFSRRGRSHSVDSSMFNVPKRLPLISSNSSNTRITDGLQILSNIPSQMDYEWLMKTMDTVTVVNDDITEKKKEKHILLHEFNSFYSLKINILTNVKNLPRFRKENIHKSSVIIVRSELWIGNQQFNDCTFDTPHIQITNGIRFGQPFFKNERKYCDLPREACISFTVYLCKPLNKNSKTGKWKYESELPLAYVRLPLIDHRNCLRNGKYALNLWPIPVYKPEYKGLKCDPYASCAFRYRATTRHRQFKHFQKKRQAYCLVVEFENKNFVVVATPLSYKWSYKSNEESDNDDDDDEYDDDSDDIHIDDDDEEEEEEKYILPKENKNKTLLKLVSISLNSGSFLINKKRSTPPSLPFNDSTTDDINNNKSPIWKKISMMNLPSLPSKAQKLLISNEDSNDLWKHVNRIVTGDVLTHISNEDRALVWDFREQLCKMHGALFTFLKCVDWRNKEQRSEAYDYLEKWAITPYLEDALECLGYEMMDTRVREYAVMMLANMHDSDLQRYLLQLVQCLKFELHHNNALIRLLMRRSLLNVDQIGHHFYWHLKSEYYRLEFCERFGLYMEEYLFMCNHNNNHSRSILVQSNILRHLLYINDRLRVLKKFEKNKISNKNYTIAELNEMLRNFLQNLNALLFKELQSSSFVLPINPRWRLTTFDVQKCKIMDSAQMPLWLEFINVDELSFNNIQILFKTGDDLRQDILTLQVLKCMDKIWLGRGLNLRLLPYSVIATDNGIGMVEIVGNSITTTRIHTNYGGGAKKGARDATTHWKYLKEKNNMKESDFENARDIYTRSCAGYCIASYVLGLGDRHPSNIMVRNKGELFHIDFSHFLGNFKSQQIIGAYVQWKRETAPFVFIPANKYVIDNGGKDANGYNQFLQYCCNAYLALRHRQRLLINLFVLMIPCQMPELIEKVHIQYMRDCLHLYDIKNENVYRHILKIVKLCLNDKRRIMDNMFHAVKHQ